MVNEELERARTELKKLGADWAILSSRENVTYVSHFETPTEFGFYADLAYAPPFGPSWDPMLTAAIQLIKEM